jgi:hypothetical protein
MVQTARKNNITGQVSNRIIKPALPSSLSYCGFDSQCDCQGYRGQYSCLFSCPFPTCLHDQEKETESLTTRKANSQLNAKVSVYDGY